MTVPFSRRHNIFAKFQESLDSLNQGTGIGLSVCKNLSDLLGADIWLDETFNCGVDGFLGSKFVICLNKPPLEEEMTDRGETQLPSPADSSNHLTKSPSSSSSLTASSTLVADVPPAELPESFSCLFVDDDMVVRKMFTRALRRAAPGWEIQEASNGETALLMVDSRHFDIIFIDHYMASFEKQLLGTETVQAMRSKGVASILCGCSANDLEQQFLDAGADAFVSKPFPCGKDEMRAEILHIIERRRHEVQAKHT